MRHLAMTAVAMTAILLAAADVRAHETTYMGTVEAADKTSVRVRTVDAQGKAADEATVFAVTKATKVTRGDKPVAFADARITPGERVVVIVAHGDEGDKNRPANASQIRLAAR